MYKDIIEMLPVIKTLENFLLSSRYAGILFKLKTSKTKYYELIFNNNFNAPVLVPKMTTDMLRLSPYFFIDDDSKFLNLEEMLIVAIGDRLDNYAAGNYSFINTRLLEKDINTIVQNNVNIEPFSENNKTKVEQRIRVIKTWYYDDNLEANAYHAVFGSACWPIHAPVSEEDIRYYSKLFNDPIKVEAPTKATYCWLMDRKYLAAGYFSDKEQITSIFPQKSNLPERLRLHYASSYLQPLEPEVDFLMPLNRFEKVNALAIFLPVNEEEDAPLGKNTLLAGEVLTSKEFSKKQFYVRRTFQTDSLNVFLVEKGDILQPGDVIAYDVEGLPALKYDLNYEDALVEDVIELWNCYKVILRIASSLDVGSRVISEYGLKGITHPRETLGTVILPSGTDDKGKEYPVDIIVGPNAMKSGSNGVRLSWLNLSCYHSGEPSEITPANTTSDEVNLMTQDLKPVIWKYGGKEHMAYCGLISLGVTDLAKDCRSTGVRIMPETLKYMLSSNNEPLKKVAHLLLDRHTSDSKKWLLNNLLKIKSKEIDQSLVVYDYNDSKLQARIKAQMFSIANRTRNDEAPNNSLLLSPFNNGFYIRFNEMLFSMPSFKLIESLTHYAGGIIGYPDFFNHANLLLLSLKNYVAGYIQGKVVEDNYAKYLFYIDSEIFSKKAALSMSVSPRVDGGNLKQLVSSYVPRGVTVVLDWNLEKKINEFYKQHNVALYEIGVRNPVIWSFQLAPKKVWTFSKFRRHLESNGIDINDVMLTDNVKGAVLRNVIDVMYDKSDTDGDLYPIAIPLDLDIQALLHDYYKNPTPLKEYEEKWIAGYIAGERSKNVVLENIEEKPFTFHSVDRTWFADTLANAAIAKTKVGSATVDLWKFHSLLEWTYLNGEITFEEFEQLRFMFSKIVQDTVIEGIKHVEGGASGYEPFALGNIKQNETLVKTILVNNMECTENFAELFVKLMKASNAKEGKIAGSIARLTSGGKSKSISKMTKNLKMINDDIKLKMSYCIMLEKTWDALIAV